jgi:hypothetical protein
LAYDAVEEANDWFSAFPLARSCRTSFRDGQIRHADLGGGGTSAKCGARFGRWAQSAACPDLMCGMQHHGRFQNAICTRWPS